MGLTSCCRCFDLRRGSLVIGITYVALSTLGVLLFTVFIALGPAVLIQPLLTAGQLDFTWVSFLLAIRVLLWVSLVTSLLTLIISALLIRGAVIDSSCLVLIWLIVQGVVLVLSSVGYIYQLITAIGTGHWLWIVLTVLSLFWVVVQWYWFAVVISYYQMLALTDTVTVFRPARGNVSRVQPFSPVNSESDDGSMTLGWFGDGDFGVGEGGVGGGGGGGDGEDGGGGGGDGD